MGLSGLMIDFDRGQVVNYLNTHYLTPVAFITPAPKLGRSLNMIITPFESWVWMCLILSLILMVINVWLLSYFYTELNKVSIKWMIVSMILKQNVIKIVPDCDPLKYVLSGWLLACVVFIQIYGSQIYSMMAFSSEIGPINSVTELARLQRAGGIQVVTTGSSLYYTWLKVKLPRELL